MEQNALPTVWAVSGPVVLLFIVAAAILLAVREANLRFGVIPSAADDKPLHPLLITGLTLVANLIGVATLVLIGRKFHTGTRLSMLILPILLVLERFLRLLWADRKRTTTYLSGMIGSVAGIVLGGWLLMRGAAADTLTKVAVSGEVKTVPLLEAIERDGTWSISLNLLVFYVVSLSIFFGLHALITRSGPRKALPALLVSFIANFAGGALLIYLAQLAAVQPRLLMVGVPLFLIVEAYSKLLRAEPQNRPANWSGLVGSSGGMAAVAFLLLKGAPLH